MILIKFKNANRIVVRKVSWNNKTLWTRQLCSVTALKNFAKSRIEMKFAWKSVKNSRKLHKGGKGPSSPRCWYFKVIYFANLTGYNTRGLLRLFEKRLYIRTICAIFSFGRRRIYLYLLVAAAAAALKMRLELLISNVNMRTDDIIIL